MSTVATVIWESKKVKAMQCCVRDGRRSEEDWTSHKLKTQFSSSPGSYKRREGRSSRADPGGSSTGDSWRNPVETPPGVGLII